MSGREPGPRAALLRAALSCASAPYVLAIDIRNGLFDAGVRKPARLSRRVISVGNITTGGTGKTPVIRWLAEQLRQAGRKPAILSRGYKAEPGTLGDEQRMLDNLLNRTGEPPVVIRADPSRFRAGQSVTRDHPEVDVFLLDDGFQHRQLARDFDLVLVSATEPFGFDRLLPRGMLREPLGGLRRASAFLLTRCDQVDEASRAKIHDVLRRYNPGAPVLESAHAHTGFRSSDASAPATNAESLRGRKWFAFCGIGDPLSFVQQLSTTAGSPVGHRFFADHHAYTAAEVASLRSAARAAGADVLVTTEKDWVKLAHLPETPGDRLPIWRADVEIQFRAGDEQALLKLIRHELDEIA